jgi:catechol 2,3-dioxygenase-like lactoylglutathione lyase family enzyme
MPSQIDHVIIGVRDLAQAAADYTAAGFTVTPGGEHTSRRTHNALIAFADTTYLELIAYREPDAQRDDDLKDDPWWQLLARGEGFLGFALRMEDATAEAAALQARGVRTNGPATGGRERPDGQHVAWRSIAVEGAGPLPFLIEDLTPRRLRIPDGAATQHPLGVTRILGLALVMEDLDASAASLAAVLGSDGISTLPPPEGASAAMRFTVGPHTIDLLKPASPESAPGRALAARGPAPYAITLGTDTSTADAMNTSTTLPLAQTHGARIRIAGIAGVAGV